MADRKMCVTNPRPCLVARVELRDSPVDLGAVTSCVAPRELASSTTGEQYSVRSPLGECEFA